MFKCDLKKAGAYLCLADFSHGKAWGMPIDHDEQKAYWGQIPKGGSMHFFIRKITWPKKSVFGFSG
jgi:hypothetical protein